MDWLYLCVMGWMLARNRQFEEECDCGYVPADERRPPGAREVPGRPWWYRWPGTLMLLLFSAALLVGTVQIFSHLQLH